jgi:hypothetical protein
MEKYYGNYLGIVVQNNDPEHRGRVKIFVPHVSVTLYDNWNKDGIDKLFKFPGNENDLDKNVIDDVKAVLPWAEAAGPLFGGNASGRYNAVKEEGTTSDSNYWEGDQLQPGNRPVQLYTNEKSYPDAFTETKKNKNRFTNPNSHQYTPSNYSNLARGMFSIPNVGAHVWVFFVDGNANIPVYFASAYSKDDFERIYSQENSTTTKDDDFSSPDYPASYENVSKTDGGSLDANSKTFRAKTVLNSNKHAIELIDTDQREILKMTHYNGSFKEFNRDSTSELATKNDQKLVVGDQFLTVKQNRAEFTEGHQELVVYGDKYKTVGSAQVQTVEEIYNILNEIHDLKRLFDIQRTGNLQYNDGFITGGNRAGENLNNIFPFDTSNAVSEVQEMNGDFAPCPICKGEPYEPLPEWDIEPDLAHFCQHGKIAGSAGKIYRSAEEIIAEFGEFACLTCSNLDPGGLAEVKGGTIPIIIPREELPGWEEFATRIGQIGYHLGSLCDVCMGTGFSPSTFLGTWTPDPAKQPGGELDGLIKARAKDLYELERQLGIGGDEIIEVSRNKVETIGLVMNDLPSHRVDPIGKLKADGVHVAIEGSYATQIPSPHVEYVDVDDMPGGDYNLTACNKYKLLVGSKGINMKTFGPIDMYGSIINMTGEQVNISSQHEVLIDGGERFSIRARTISLLPVEHRPVCVEGQLHVTRNVVIQGGTMTEGEVGLLHATAPREYGDTEYAGCDSVRVVLDNGIPDVPNPPATIGGFPLFAELPAHTHKYERIPTDFYNSHEAVRDEMIKKGINSLSRVAAAGAVGGVGQFDPETFTSTILPAANDAALAVQNSAGYTRLASVSDAGDGNLLYELLYNYNVNDVPGERNFRPEGMTVSVTFNPEGNNIVGRPSVETSD